MADEEELNNEQENEFNLEKELESQPFITQIDFDPDISDFKAAYRKGNFGLKRGRIDLLVARRWSVAHLVVVLVMFSLFLTMAILMGRNDNYSMDKGLSNTFTIWCVLSGIAGTLTTCCSLYLVRRLARLRRPLFLLLFVRLLAVLECFFVLSALVTTFFVVANVKDDSPARHATLPQTHYRSEMASTTAYRWRRGVVYVSPSYAMKNKINYKYTNAYTQTTVKPPKHRLPTTVPTKWETEEDNYIKGNVNAATMPSQYYKNTGYETNPITEGYYRTTAKERGYYMTTANWRRWKSKESVIVNEPTTKVSWLDYYKTVTTYHTTGDKLWYFRRPTKNYQRSKHVDHVDSGAFRILCVFLVITLIADLIATMVWLFHWWQCWGCFECFKSLAIFQPGEPLVNDVSDPRNSIISECAYLCWAAYNGVNCGTII